MEAAHQAVWVAEPRGCWGLPWAALTRPATNVDSAHKHTKVTLESPGGSGIPAKGLASNRFSGKRFTRRGSVTASNSRSRAARSSGSIYHSTVQPL